MAISETALQNLDPKSTIVSFWYDQKGEDFLTKTTERRVKNDDGTTTTTGSRKETVKAVLDVELSDITRRTFRQGRLGVRLDYKSTIDRQIARMGGEPIEWTPKEKNGFVPVDGYQNLLWRSIKSGEIALQVYDYHTLEEQYFIKGEPVSKETLAKFFPTYKEKFFTIDGQPVLVDGEKISMKGITPKSFYLSQMSDLKIKGQVL